MDITCLCEKKKDVVVTKTKNQGVSHDNEKGATEQPKTKKAYQYLFDRRSTF